MLISLDGFEVRDWRPDDAPSLALYANDARIARTLRDRFPHPYTRADADAFIAMATAMAPRTFFAIVVEGRAVGGIGYTLHGDVERASAEIGYWLGAAFWGRGIVTAAVTAVTAYAFAEHSDLRRIFAVPFATSTASIRVLGKAGYRLEGRMRQSAIKNGRVTDQLLYATYRDAGQVVPRPAADCVFCAIAAGRVTPGVVAYNDACTAVFPSKHQQPRNRGHMLVVPAAHVATIYDVPASLGGALLGTVSAVAKAVKRAWRADGVSVRQNNEPHGGQDVFHVHFHVIPRFAGDRFDLGEDRFPFGAVEVPLADRIEQAARLREALSSSAD